MIRRILIWVVTIAFAAILIVAMCASVWAWLLSWGVSAWILRRELGEMGQRHHPRIRLPTQHCRQGTGSHLAQGKTTIQKKQEKPLTHKKPFDTLATKTMPNQ